MTSTWYHDPYRIEPVTCGHEKGCLCGRCTEHRAKLLRIRAAYGAAEAIAQAVRDKEAISEEIEQARAAIENGALMRRGDPVVLPPSPVLRPCAELPVYGVTGPAVSAGQAYYPGTGGIFGVVPVREERPGVWVPDPDGYCQVAASPPPEEPGPEDEAAAIWRSLWEPSLLSPDELDKLAPFGGPGSCTGCGLPAVAGKPMCHYCAALHALTVTGKFPAASPVETELAQRALTCTHGPGAAWVRDGRCQRCGRYAIRAAPGAPPAGLPAARRKDHLVMDLLLGMAVILIVVLSGVPHLMVLPGILLIVHAFRRAAGK